MRLSISSTLLSLLTAGFLISGCLPKTLGDDTGGIDADGDGHFAASDCNDAEANVNPDIEEVCDGIDNNCDGEIDEGVETTWHPDSDGDGFGDVATSMEACDAPSGHVEDGTDCNDADAEINPETTWYADTDGDGFGDAADVGAVACEAPSITVRDNTDCDDTTASVNPDATEFCNEIDDDCDGTVDVDGLVSFEDATGAWVDDSADFQGTSDTPANPSLDAPGTWHICSGTYYANVVISESISMFGHGTAPEDVVLDGAATERVVEVDTGEHVVAIENLTLTNGLAATPSDIWTDVEGGGILCEGIDNGGHASLSLTNVVVSGNEGALYSGGVGANRCDLVISGSVISDNSAEVAGGIGLFDSDGVIDGTEITGNSAEYYAGGLDLVSDFDSVQVTLTNSVINSNLLTVGDEFGGGLYLEGAHFESIGNDWADRGGTDDNSPNDIYVDGVEVGFDYDSADWDFVCDSTGCSPGRWVTELGGTDYATSPWTWTSRVRGNYMSMDTETTIESFSMYLDPDSSCSGDSLQFYVVQIGSLPGSSTAEDWTVVWSAEVPISTTAEEDYSSGPINEVLASGGNYGFVAAWSCSVTYSGGGEDLMSTDVGPGTYVGGMGSISVPSSLAGVGDSFSLSSYATSQNYGYSQTLYHFY